MASWCSDGDAVAWREWLAGRAGRAEALLIKTFAGASLWRGLPAAPSTQRSRRRDLACGTRAAGA
jgi:hypothetical protein